MKLWVRSHPRKVRGERIHETAEERRVRMLQDQEKEQMEKTSEVDTIVEETKQEDAFNLALDAQDIRCQMPKVDCYVETEEVRRIKEKVKLWLTTGYPVHIIGPTGCGKSTLAWRVAEELEIPMVWMNGDEMMTTADLIGGYSRIETETLRDRFVRTVLKTKDTMRAGWVNNPLTIACKNGYAFIYNDFSRAKPEVNNVLLSVFQEKILELPTRFGGERYIKVHPEFRAILTSNSIDYAGVHRPQDALLDRTVGVYMDYYSFVTEVEIVKAHSKISQSEAETIVKVIRGLREKLPETEKLGTRACIMIAQGLVTSGGRIEDLLEDFCIDILATKVKGLSDLAAKQQMVKEIAVSVKEESRAIVG